MLFFKSPLYPSITTKGWMPLSRLKRAMERRAAFIPGASPPDVKMAIFVDEEVIPETHVANSGGEGKGDKGEGEERDETVVARVASKANEEHIT